MSTSRWPVAPVPHSNSAWRIEMKLNLELTCRYPLQPPLHPSGWALDQVEGGGREGGREGRREGDGGRNSPIPGIGKFERAYGMPSRRSASWFAYSLRLPNSIRMSRWIWNWIWGLVQHLINKISSEILEFARGKSDKCAAYSHPWRHRLRLGRNIRWSHSKIINSIISYHLALFFGGGEELQDLDEDSWNPIWEISDEFGRKWRRSVSNRCPWIDWNSIANIINK